MEESERIVREWLERNRGQYRHPFFNLSGFVLHLYNSAKSSSYITYNLYQEYMIRNNFNKMNFHVNEISVHHDDIVSFIYLYDQSHIHKMIYEIFLGLIKLLLSDNESIDFLDIGTGPTCGLYGKNFENILYRDIDLDRVNFVGIDNVYMPNESVFKNSVYRKTDIFSFKSNKNFDIITGHHVLEHCFEWEKVIQVMCNILKIDGYIYLSFPTFGSFYDTTYRLMAPGDHCVSFDFSDLVNFSKKIGLELVYSDIYVDPNFRFNWMSNLAPDLINKNVADAFYDLCVRIDAKSLLGFHDYGKYAIFRKIR